MLALPAEIVAVLPVKAAEDAFASMAMRGWRCGASRRTGSRVGGNFRLYLLRAAELPTSAEASLEPSLPASWDAVPEESWVGAGVRVLASPFGSDAPLSRTVTRGVLSNVSTPPGIVLLDARCMEATAGGGVLLEESSCLIGLMAPLLKSSSNETVVLSIAIPLVHVAEALLDNPAASRSLRVEELHSLAPQPDIPRSVAPDARLAGVARRGVVMLWLETTGSWASAVVVSKAGHLLTCAHLLTGRSWMEVPAESSSEGQQKAPPARRPPPPPRRCRGRGQTLAPDGRFVETEFEAEVLHIADGHLDVALLLARSAASPAAARPSGAAASGGPSARNLEFYPLAWRKAPPAEGGEVWAIGHGLFGPGTPWRGPAVTAGQVAKVAVGLESRRPAVLQSSAAVHRGCSGGALVDARAGELLGLVTTNVKQQDGAVMPHVNFSLPTALLEPLEEFLKDPYGPASLETLVASWKHYAADEQEQSLWRLEPDPLDLPSRVEERKQQALEKMQKLAEDANASEAADVADAAAAAPGKVSPLAGAGAAEEAPPPEARPPVVGGPQKLLHRSAL